MNTRHQTNRAQNSFIHKIIIPRMVRNRSGIVSRSSTLCTFVSRRAPSWAPDSSRRRPSSRQLGRGARRATNVFAGPSQKSYRFRNFQVASNYNSKFTTRKTNLQTQHLKHSFLLRLICTYKIIKCYLREAMLVWHTIPITSLYSKHDQAIPGLRLIFVPISKQENGKRKTDTSQLTYVVQLSPLSKIFGIKSGTGPKPKPNPTPKWSKKLTLTLPPILTLT